MTVPVNAILQVAFMASYPESSVLQNVWHLKLEGSAPAAEGLVQGAVELFLETVYANLESFWTADLVTPWYTIDEMAFSGVTDRWYVYRRIAEGLVGGLVGTSVADILPAGVAPYVEFLPVYRRHRGYKYLFGITEAANDPDGTPSSALVSALAAFAVDALAEYTVETGVSVLYYVIPVTDAGLHNIPNAAIVRNTWGYQRRRKKGVGQ